MHQTMARYLDIPLTLNFRTCFLTLSWSSIPMSMRQGSQFITRSKTQPFSTCLLSCACIFIYRNRDKRDSISIDTKEKSNKQTYSIVYVRDILVHQYRLKLNSILCASQVFTCIRSLLYIHMLNMLIFNSLEQLLQITSFTQSIKKIF